MDIRVLVFNSGTFNRAELSKMSEQELWQLWEKDDDQAQVQMYYLDEFSCAFNDEEVSDQDWLYFVDYDNIKQDAEPQKVWVVSIVEYKADENYLDSYTELYADEQQAKARVDEYSTKAIDAAPEHDGLDDGGELVGEQGYVTYFKNGDIAKVKYMEKELK